MKKNCLAFPLLTLFSLPVLAHTSDIGAATMHNTVVAGFMHPLTGLDHLIAMLMAGLLIAHLGVRQLLTAAAILLMALLAGTALGAMFGGYALVETLVFASCLLIVASLVKKHLSVMTATSCHVLLASVFILHGWAHGSELPHEQAGVFIVGYLGGALLLLSTGVAVGYFLSFLKARMHTFNAA